MSLNTLVEICGGDKTFILEMIDLFLAQADPQVDEIEKAIKEKDCGNLKRSAHKFKSSAQLFEITCLVELLLQIESSGLKELEEKEKKIIIKKVRDISKLACHQIKEDRKNYI